MTELITCEIENRCCTLSLNRPESLNALNRELFSQLQMHIQTVEKMATDIGCVILRGNGRAFSAGHDLKDIAAGEIEVNDAFEATVLESLATLPQPVIAQVHGFCFTGALELALACDLIFIDEDTILADTHCEWGLSPVWGMTQRLPRRIGIANAKDMMFSGRKVAAVEALAMGLVNRVYTVEALQAMTRSYAEDICANSGYSHAAYKQILTATDGLRLHDGLDYEYSNSPGACADMQMRVDRFMSRSKA